MKIDMDAVHFTRNRQTLAIGWFLHLEIPYPPPVCNVRHFGLGGVPNRPYRSVEIELHIIRLD